MMGEANLVDAKTGETIIARPGLMGLVGASPGTGKVVGEVVDEPIEEVVKAFVAVYSTWLLSK